LTAERLRAPVVSPESAPRCRATASISSKTMTCSAEPSPAAAYLRYVIYMIYMI
jgi:hypothetical protein